MISFHHSAIVSIDEIGLVYTDLEGNKVQIRFDECRRNWVDYVNASAEFERANLSEEETRCVGRRNAFETTPYIEIFTEPRIKFIYPYKQTVYEWFRKIGSRKGYRHFRATCDAFVANGWSTFDLG